MKAGQGTAENTLQLISKQTRAEIDRWIEKYPEDQKRSAVMAALRIVQDQNNGYLTNELMDAVAEYLDMPPIAVYEVATFYSMYELEPVGRQRFVFVPIFPACYVAPTPLWDILQRSWVSSSVKPLLMVASHSKKSNASEPV